MSTGGEQTYCCQWCDGKTRKYYRIDGRWCDKNGIDRSYLFDEQDNYLGFRRKNKGHDKGTNRRMRDGKGKHKDTGGWVRNGKAAKRDHDGESMPLPLGTLQVTGLDADYNCILEYSEEPVEAIACVEAIVDALDYAGTFPDLAAADEDGESKPGPWWSSSSGWQENGEADEENEEDPPQEDGPTERAEEPSMLQRFMVQKSALRQFVAQSGDSMDLEKATKMWWMEHIANMGVTDLAKLTSSAKNVVAMESFPSFVMRMKWHQWHESLLGSDKDDDGA